MTFTGIYFLDANLQNIPNLVPPRNFTSKDPQFQSLFGIYFEQLMKWVNDEDAAFGINNNPVWYKYAVRRPLNLATGEPEALKDPDTGLPADGWERGVLNRFDDSQLSGVDFEGFFDFGVGIGVRPFAWRKPITPLEVVGGETIQALTISGTELNWQNYIQDLYNNIEDFEDGLISGLTPFGLQARINTFDGAMLTDNFEAWEGGGGRIADQVRSSFFASKDAPSAFNTAFLNDIILARNGVPDMALERVRPSFYWAVWKEGDDQIFTIDMFRARKDNSGENALVNAIRVRDSNGVPIKIKSVTTSIDTGGNDDGFSERGRGGDHSYVSIYVLATDGRVYHVAADGRAVGIRTTIPGGLDIVGVNTTLFLTSSVVGVALPDPISGASTEPVASLGTPTNLLTLKGLGGHISTSDVYIPGQGFFRFTFTDPFPPTQNFVGIKGLTDPSFNDFTGHGALVIVGGLPNSLSKFFATNGTSRTLSTYDVRPLGPSFPNPTEPITGFSNPDHEGEFTQEAVNLQFVCNWDNENFPAGTLRARPLHLLTYKIQPLKFQLRTRLTNKYPTQVRFNLDPFARSSIAHFSATGEAQLKLPDEIPYAVIGDPRTTQEELDSVLAGTLVEFDAMFNGIGNQIFRSLNASKATVPTPVTSGDPSVEVGDDTGTIKVTVLKNARGRFQLEAEDSLERVIPVTSGIDENGDPAEYLTAKRKHSATWKIFERTWPINFGPLSPVGNRVQGIRGETGEPGETGGDVAILDIYGASMSTFKDPVFSGVVIPDDVGLKGTSSNSSIVELEDNVTTSGSEFVPLGTFGSKRADFTQNAAQPALDHPNQARYVNVRAKAVGSATLTFEDQGTTDKISFILNVWRIGPFTTTLTVGTPITIEIEGTASLPIRWTSSDLSLAVVVNDPNDPKKAILTPIGATTADNKLTVTAEDFNEGFFKVKDITINPAP